MKRLAEYVGLVLDFAPELILYLLIATDVFFNLQAARYARQNAESMIVAGKILHAIQLNTSRAAESLEVIEKLADKHL